MNKNLIKTILLNYESSPLKIELHSKIKEELGNTELFFLDRERNVEKIFRVISSILLPLEYPIIRIMRSSNRFDMGHFLIFISDYQSREDYYCYPEDMLVTYFWPDNIESFEKLNIEINESIKKMKFLYD